MRVAIVLGLLAACGGDDATTGGDDAHAFCLSESNRYRDGAGKPALASSSALQSYADEGAMVDFSSSPHNHFASTSGGGIALAENECPHQLGWGISPGEDVKTVVGQCVKAFFDGGPGEGHYENLMGPYAKLGCGIYIEGDQITIVQDFGN